METEEIERLCESLSLAEDEGEPIIITKRDMEEGEKKIARSLVGKVLSNKLVHKEGFRVAIQLMWRSVKGVKIESLGGNKFLFEFTSVEERRRVLNSGPWNFDKALIVLEEPQGIGELSKLKFESTPFWIQIHNLPILCMNKNMGNNLGSHIGEVMEVDTGSSGDCNGSFIRIRIKLDITKPLLRCLRLKTGTRDNDIMILPLKYEKLPDFCFHCGIVGHVFRECANGGPVREGKDSAEVFKYGEWMRAQTMKTRGGPPMKTESRRVKDHGKDAGKMMSEEEEESGKQGGETVETMRGGDLETIPPKIVSMGAASGKETEDIRKGCREGLESKSNQGVVHKDGMASDMIPEMITDLANQNKVSTKKAGKGVQNNEREIMPPASMGQDGNSFGPVVSMGPMNEKLTTV